MNTTKKIKLLEWWIRQQEHARKDLYVLRLDQSGLVFGKQLRNPLVNPMHGKGKWQLLNRGVAESTDWGYLWFSFKEPTEFERVCKCRKVILFTSKLKVTRYIHEGRFLYVAVGPSGFFGNFSASI